NYMAIIDGFNRTPFITYGMFIKDKTNKYKNDIFNTQNWEYDEINDEFIWPNHKRLGFKRYAYRHDKYGFRRDFNLYECDDCSECPLKNHCIKSNSKSNKKIKIKLKKIKIIFIILKIINIMKSMKNLFGQIIKDFVLKSMPIAMINMDLGEILTYMNEMIVQNVH